MDRDTSETTHQNTVLAPEALNQLITHLIDQGYHVVGPKLNHGVVHLQEITDSHDLAQGVTDTQSPGRYSIQQHPPETSAGQAFFSHQVGPDSARAKLLPHRTLLWQAQKQSKEAATFEINAPNTPVKKWAFLGLRACDLAAIAIQDRVFLHDSYQQTTYATHRQNCLIIAVQCTTHTHTCFCTSMNSGPHIDSGFDLLLTEVCNEHSHWLLAQAGSTAGETLQQALDLPVAEQTQIDAAGSAVQKNADSMPRWDFSNLRTALQAQPENPWWAEVAERCLGCANCTLVCPTCFCTTVEDSTDLTGEHAERWLQWDSCFNEGHSQMHHGQVHQSIQSRYRQWLTHKFSTWHDQFDSSGCVGCGRCISWCPVGIDVREAIEPFSQTAETNHCDSTTSKIIQTISL